MKRLLYDLRMLLRRFSRQPATCREGPLSYAIPADVGVARLTAALQALTPPDHPGPGAHDDERPVFVLGNGWRTGSTLLQRICGTDPELMIWGESLGNMGLITRTVEGLCMAEPGGWPWPDSWLSQQDAGTIRESDQRVTEFIANLSPPSTCVRASLQEWLDCWLGRPARELGFDRWGLKEVRLGALEALFLRWLFPRATFLAIVRNPLDAYRSVRDAGGGLWIEPRTQDPGSFARHWNRLALSWQELGDSFPIQVLRFEDLVAGTADLARTQEVTGLTLDAPRALAVRSGASTRAGSSLDAETRAVILRETSAGRPAWGYE